MELEEKIAAITTESKDRLARASKEIESRLNAEKSLAITREIEKHLQMQITITQQAERIKALEKGKKQTSY